MKRIALLMVAIGVGFTGLSYYNGLRLERDFEAGLSRLLAQANASGFEITTEYSRGVFQSTAQSKANWAGHSTLTMQHQIAHGPIPWVGLRRGARPGRTWIESEISFGLGQDPRFAAVFSDVPPLRVRTSVNFAGDGTSEFRWPAFEGNSPQAGRIAIAELLGEVEFGGPSEQALGFIKWGGMKIESPLYSAQVAAMSGEFAYEDVLKPSLYGQSSFELASITAQAAGQPVADLRDLSWAEQRAVEGGKIFLRSQLHVGSLTVTKTELSAASFESQFENIDLSAWKQLREYAQTASGYSTASATLSSPNSNEMMGMFRTFVAADPTVSMQLNALVNGERLSADAHARFGAGATDGNLKVEAWARALDADLSVRIPAALLDPWLQSRGGLGGGKAAQLRMLQEQGVLLRTATNAYETRLQYEHGELLVNGVPFEALKERGHPRRNR